MRNLWQSTAARLFPYAVAIALVGGVLALRLVLAEFGVAQNRAYLLLTLPTLGAAWLWGLGPGLAAGGASVVGIHYVLLPPYYQFGPVTLEQLLEFVIFLLMCAFIAWLGQSRLTVMWRFEQANAELEDRVQERTAELVSANELLAQEMEAKEAFVEELELANERLSISNRELQDFASVASHDLQEPLRKIQAFGDRLQTRCEAALSEEGRDYLQRIRSAAVRMQTLINDLLTFSRVSSKARAFTRVDLNIIAREVLDDMEARVQEVGARIQVGPLPVIDADPLQMRQLLQNLLSNALKFRRPDVAPQVRIYDDGTPAGQTGLFRERPGCTICIEDNGIGFDEKYLDRIFNVFQRLHGRGVYEGTGIGLAVCRRIVERHGGRITARSMPGAGSQFIVKLPLRQQRAENGS